MYAIVQTGGKQYKVALDTIIEIEKLPVEVGATVELDTLMVFKDAGVVENNPKTKVKATVVAQVRDKKIVVYKYKAKKNERKKQGHRQPHTKIKILSI
ncbi:MAG: 50S ribosomal protein L21 [Firmicutes bacterium]|nr:50S ribosomal protein L21 [Bacillota bacterium]MCL1953342.1 50S ribosomal protein L21 [Bacillota bacterium]